MYVLCCAFVNLLDQVKKELLEQFNVKVAYHSFDGLQQPNIELFSKMFRDVFLFFHSIWNLNNRPFY